MSWLRGFLCQYISMSVHLSQGLLQVANEMACEEFIRSGATVTLEAARGYGYALEAARGYGYATSCN